MDTDLGAHSYLNKTFVIVKNAIASNGLRPTLTATDSKAII